MADSKWEIISTLWDVAEDYEAEVLADLLVRAGWIWRCKCGEDVDKDIAICPYCNSLRGTSELK